MDKEETCDSFSVPVTLAQAWINAMTTHDDDDDNPTTSWRDHVLKDWQIAIQIAHAKLLSTSTNTRLAFLRDDLAWLANQGMHVHRCTRCADTPQTSPSHRSSMSSNCSQRHIPATSIPHHAMP